MTKNCKYIALLAQTLEKRPVRSGFILGAITVLGFAPSSVFLIPILTCALLFFLLHEETAKKIFLISFSFSFGLLIAGTSWIYVSLHDFGGMHPVLAIFATILLSATFALPPAIIQALLAKVVPSPHRRLLVILPIGLALSDWCRGWFLTGFPWLSIGYSQIPISPLSNYAPVLGIYGVSLACACCSGSLGYLFKYLATKEINPNWKVGLIMPTLILCLSIALAPIKWTEKISQKSTTVSLLQGNIAQNVKWTPEWLSKTMMIYLDMVRQEKTDLILLPETAIPLLSTNVPEWYWKALREHAQKNDSHILLGIPEKSEEGKFYNSVLHISSDKTNRYRKHHLVPFGDYFPMRSITSVLLNALSMPMSNFSSGAANQKPFDLGKQILGVDICYEDAFGEEIIRQLPEATVLANFTNDAWWGESFGPQQHLQIAQARSIETGRELLRVTNTGVTAVINHRGHIITRLPQFSENVLRAEIYGRKGITPYSQWGNLAFVLLSFIIILLSLKSRPYWSKTEKR
ncbi:MAG: apolipoprotein N-acyltransferase [Burkholderiales bacterium]|nr:apolipoprotein N-acyltransferase [Burkholderiales bacterium]